MCAKKIEGPPPPQGRLPPYIPRVKDELIERSPKFQEWLEWFAKNWPDTSKWIRARELKVEKFLKEAALVPGAFVKTRDYGFKIPPEERIKFFVERLHEMLKTHRALRYYLENCTHCGYCIDKCHMWLAFRNYRNSPVGRADLVRMIYKYYNKVTGKLFGKLVDAKELSEALLDELWIYSHQCTQCRRCAYFCPFGIDCAEIMRAVRQIFAEMGLVYEFVGATMRSLAQYGNQMFLTYKSIRVVLDMLEEEIKTEKGIEVHIPLDKPKAKILFLPSSTDVFTNLDTMKGFAVVMHKLGLDWTMRSEIFEIGNFGLFISDYHMQFRDRRIVEVAEKIGAEIVVFGECGHGWRPFKNYVVPELEKRGIKAMHFMHLVVWAIKKGKLRFNKKQFEHVVTYHDPCNLARAGDLIEEPRIILRTIFGGDFVEREHNRERTLCCGAGTGLLGDDVMPLRVWAGWPSVYDAWKTGADILATPCSIDKAQFPVVIEYHKVPMMCKGIADLIYYTIEV